jgi:hypothetical protein
MQAELRQLNNEIEQATRELKFEFESGTRDPKTQRETLFPYEHVDMAIDHMAIKLDGVRLETEEWMQNQRASDT